MGKEFNIIKKLYDGELMFADSQIVDKKLDDIYSEIEKIKNTKEIIEQERLINLYEDAIEITQYECFAQGMKFMNDLNKEIDLI